jgi:hypothetical protein
VKAQLAERIMRPEKSASAADQLHYLADAGPRNLVESNLLCSPPLHGSM